MVEARMAQEVKGAGINAHDATFGPWRVWFDPPPIGGRNCDWHYQYEDAEPEGPSWMHGHCASRDECISEIIEGYEDRAPAELQAEARELVGDLWGALNFILAFYEPGQNYLDTNAWKQAEAGGRAAHAKARVWLDNQGFGSKRLAAPVDPQHPYTVGPEDNARIVGWTDYFKGRARSFCPFPPDRKDLRTKFEEGWDAAKRSHESGE